MEEKIKQILEFLYKNLESFWLGKRIWMAEIQRAQDQAEARIEEERRAYTDFLFEEDAMREVWEDSSTVVTAFCENYRKRAATYDYRGKIGAIAEKMTEQINALEQPMAERLLWYELENGILKKAERPSFSIPDIKQKVEFASDMDARIVACIQKKRRALSGEEDKIGNCYRESTYQEIKECYRNQIEEDTDACYKAMACVVQKVKADFFVYLEEELKNQIGVDEKEGSRRLFLLEKEYARMGGYTNEVSYFPYRNEDGSFSYEKLPKSAQIVGCLPGRAEDVLQFWKEQITEWKKRRLAENKGYRTESMAYRRGLTKEQPQKPKCMEKMWPVFTQNEALKNQCAVLEQVDFRGKYDELQQFYREALTELLLDDNAL